MVKFSFSKNLRLLTSSQYVYVFQKPQKNEIPQITILGRLNSLGYPRTGLIVTKKNIKNAHERNRIKRLMRESFRLHQYKLPPMDFIIIAKKRITNLSNCTILEELEKLWHYYYRLAQ